MHLHISSGSIALLLIALFGIYGNTHAYPNVDRTIPQYWPGEQLENTADFIPRKLDYIVTNTTLTYNKPVTSESQDYVVEIAIVCDKEWGDMFQHNREKALKYWSTFFWDINQRYQTLPSSNISFLITSITVIRTLDEQQFIESVRDSDGKVPLNSVLASFRAWIYEHVDQFPKFDMAMLALAAENSVAEGMAYLNGACLQHNAVVFSDRGLFNVNAAGHELAHNLGARHDVDVEGCTAEGYIMSGMRGYPGYYFSDCSDREIKAYVTSDQAECLVSIDEPNGPVISQDFAFEAFSRQEQCVLKRGEGAIYDFGDCLQARCWLGNGYTMFTPMDNTECMNGQGRCVRSKCLQNTFTSISNTKSKQCILQADRFDQAGGAKMNSCPPMQTPNNQFTTERVNQGYWIRTRFSPSGGVSGDEWKCLEASSVVGGQVGFGICAGNGLVEWELERLEPHRYLLKESTTQRCVMQDGDSVVMANCDKQDQTMWWQVEITE